MLTNLSVEATTLPDVPSNLGWFLTFILILSGSGPVLTVIMHFKTEKRKRESEVKKNENEIVFNEAEATQRIIKAGDEHWAEREARFLKRENDLEAEVAELRDEVKDLRVYVSDLMAFVIAEQGWHFDDERERRANGERVKNHIDFEIFMNERKTSRKMFMEHTNGSA